ncbi:AEC family transporter, partial [Streptomyces sp. NPDC006386]
AAQLFRLGSHALIIAVLFQALPTATSSYILSRQLGGDAPLMAGITATQTLLGIAAVPIVVALVPA